MEETDMGHSIAAARALQQAIPNTCTAKTLGPGQRLSLGLQTLAGHCTITDLADQADVSRKFVYQQRDRAQTALDDAFAPTVADDEVLFSLPITKHWLKQAALALTLICHSSYRGVHEFYRDLLRVHMAPATVHNIVHDAIAKARCLNLKQHLANVRIAGLDEIFQNRQPVLVGADLPESPPAGAGFIRQSEAPPAGVNVADRLLTLTRDLQRNTKIGVRTGTLVWVGARELLRIDSPRVPGARYPDDSSAQIYTSAGPLAYVELEMLGPIEHLAAGGHIERQATYTLARRTGDDPMTDLRKLLGR